MLDIKNLCIEFTAGNSPNQVVHDFNLSMSSGEIVGIVGESGSGKTLTALTIAGLLGHQSARASGEIYLEGTDLLRLNRKELRYYQGRDISMVFQEPMSSLNPLMKIGHQVEESMRIHTSLSKSDRLGLALAALSSVELSNPERIYSLYPHQLSGGMRQRAMIAAAIISNPKLLIADEPTTALDVTIQAQIIALLKKINQEQGVSILFISHDLSVVRHLCTRVVVMQKGVIVEQGDTDKIFSSPNAPYTKKLIASIPSRRKRNG